MHGIRDKLVKRLYGGKNKTSIVILPLGQPGSILSKAGDLSGTSERERL